MIVAIVEGYKDIHSNHAKERLGLAHRLCAHSLTRGSTTSEDHTPAAKGGNPKISDIVFFSADYSSLGCI